MKKIFILMLIFVLFGCSANNGSQYVAPFKNGVYNLVDDGYVIFSTDVVDDKLVYNKEFVSYNGIYHDYDTIEIKKDIIYFPIKEYSYAIEKIKTDNSGLQNMFKELYFFRQDNDYRRIYLIKDGNKITIIDYYERYNSEYRTYEIKK